MSNACTFCDDAKTWSRFGATVACPRCTDEGRLLGLRAAREFGASAQANEEFWQDYLEDISYYLGFEKWSELGAELKQEARKAFNEGRSAERVARNQGRT